MVSKNTTRVNSLSVVDQVQIMIVEEKATEESEVVLTPSGPLLSITQEDIEPLDKEVATLPLSSFISIGLLSLYLFQGLID